MLAGLLVSLSLCQPHLWRHSITSAEAPDFSRG